jgi:hypothetical protein
LQETSRNFLTAQAATTASTACPEFQPLIRAIPWQRPFVAAKGSNAAERFPASFMVKDFLPHQTFAASKKHDIFCWLTNWAEQLPALASFSMTNSINIWGVAYVGRPHKNNFDLQCQACHTAEVFSLLRRQVRY